MVIANDSSGSEASPFRKEKRGMLSEIRVLAVGDDASQCESFRRFLQPSSIEAQVAEGTAAAVSLLASGRFHAVVWDLGMSEDGKGEVLQFIRSQALSTPVIIIGRGEEEIAEECLAAGAFDFLSNPVDHLALLAVLRRALLRSGLVFEESKAPPPAIQPRLHFPHLVGKSGAMEDVLWRIAKVADADTNVCIYGETGTGKELVAGAIHASGPRANRPLIVLDCAAIPEGLMESEMFGHVRGSFTSAMSDREGVFQLADGGSLFLDEVGELTLPLQAKLLRVIQCREFRRVGGKHPIRVDVRILAGTNKDLRSMVAEGKFREELFYRLDVIPITLPPLRQRQGDIPLLVEHSIEKCNRKNNKQIRGVSSRGMALLLRHHWPGNVRELENCIERASVLAEKDILDVTDLAPILRSAGNGVSLAPSNGVTRPPSLREAEQDLILETLQRVQSNRAQAAELLGISLRGLYYKIESLREEGLLEGTKRR
jgi:DNA-binding NtrC family response regulator